ncbi:MAG: twin-arginine translocase subunit TatB [Syntrophomonadaceae bacterium]|nr:twin-arginine translocase subunit TatB [Syntrophomonadaceae bacterium]
MFGFIGNIGPWELIVIMLIALIVVGPSKLPEVARSMGKALNDFRRATSGVQREFEEALKYEPAPAKDNIDNGTASAEETAPTASAAEDVDDVEVADNKEIDTETVEEAIEVNPENQEEN